MRRAFSFATIAGIAALGWGSCAAADDKDLCHKGGIGDAEIAACSRLMAAGTDAAQAHIRRCYLYNRRGDDNFERAIADCTEILKREPRNVYALSIRANGYVRKDNFAAAEADLAEARRIAPQENWVRNIYGYFYFMRGDNERALEELDEILRGSPNHTSARRHRGLVFESKGEYTKALADFRAALVSDPNRKEVLGREAAEGIQRVDRKLAAQSPRSCPSDTTGSVKRVDFRSSNFNGDIRRVACNEWVETNSRGNRWIFRPITNNGSELVLHDGSRDIYFKADFSARKMAFRNGAKAAWAGHSDIVSSERVGGDVSAPDRPSVAKKGTDAPKPKAAKATVPTGPARSARRIALVIGNAKYPDVETPLSRPTKDAQAIAAELRKNGFDVEVGEDLTRRGLHEALAAFKAKITPGSVALLFFSGYGIQAGQKTYILPVDAQVWTEKDVGRDGTSLESLLTEIEDKEPARRSSSSMRRGATRSNVASAACRSALRRSPRRPEPWCCMRLRPARWRATIPVFSSES